MDYDTIRCQDGEIVSTAVRLRLSVRPSWAKSARGLIAAICVNPVTMSGNSGKNCITHFAGSLSIGGRYETVDSNLAVRLITTAVSNDGL
jgi:hypothetical protein